MAQKILGIQSINNKKILELQDDPTTDGTGLINIEQGSLGIFANTLFVKQSLKGGTATDWNQLATGGAAWGLAGNSLAGTETIGSNNAFDFDLKSNGTVRLTLLSAGNVQLDDTADLVPTTAAGSDLGTTALPFGTVVANNVLSDDATLNISSSSANNIIMSSAGTTTFTVDSEGTPVSYVLNATGLNMATKIISNTADPVNAQDVSTKNYVDGLVNPLLNSVRFREYAKVLTTDDLSAVANSTALSTLLEFGDDNGSVLILADFADGDFFISNADDAVNGASLWRIFDDAGTLRVTKLGVTQPIDTYAYHVKFNLKNPSDALEKRAIFAAEDNAGIVTMIKVADETFAGGTGVELLANTPIDTVGGVVAGTNSIGTTDSVTLAIQKLMFDVNTLGSPSPKWSIGGDNFGATVFENFGSTSNTDVDIIRNSVSKLRINVGQTITGNSIIPNADNSLTLGGSGASFNSIYADTFQLSDAGNKAGSLSQIGTDGVSLRAETNMNLNTEVRAAEEGNSGFISLATGSSADGNSGAIALQTGTAPSGTRGVITLNGLSVNLANSQINNVVDPTLAQDAATKNYVDTSAWLIGGNALAASQDIGSTTNFDVNIIRNSDVRISIGSANTDISTGEQGIMNLAVGDAATVSTALETVSIAYQDSSVTDEGVNVIGIFTSELNKKIVLTSLTNSTTSGSTSDVGLFSGGNTNGANAVPTGSIDIGSGAHAGTGDSGIVRVTTGSVASGTAGDIYIQTGEQAPNGAEINQSGRVYINADRIRFFTELEMRVRGVGSITEVSGETVDIAGIFDNIANGQGNSVRVRGSGVDSAFSPADSDGGHLLLSGGSSSTTGASSTGGSVFISAGSSDNGDGGDVDILSGQSGSAGGTIGNININTQSSGVASTVGDITLLCGTNSVGSRGKVRVIDTIFTLSHESGASQLDMGFEGSFDDPLGQTVSTFYISDNGNSDNAITLKTADTNASGSGEINLITGDAIGAANNSANIVINTGSSALADRGSLVVLTDSIQYSQDSVNSLSIIDDNSGSFSINANDVTGANNAYGVGIEGGNSVNGTAGSVGLVAGVASGTGDDGLVLIKGDSINQQYVSGGAVVASQTELARKVSTSNAAQTTVLTDSSLADGNMYKYIVTYACYDSTNQANLFVRTVHVKRIGGTATIVLETTDFTSEENINTDVSSTTTGGNVNFTVTGEVANTINWTVKVEKLELDI